MKRFVLETLVATVAVGSFCAMTQAGQLISEYDLEQIGLTEHWSAKLPLQSGDFVTDAYLADDALFVVTHNGILFAVQTDVGLIRWARKVSQKNLPVYEPTYVLTRSGDGPLIVPTSGQVKVLDRYTGKMLVAFTPDFSRTSAVAGLGNAMFVGSTDQKLRALIWQTSLAPPPLRLWEVHVGGIIHAKPLVFDGDKVLLATSTGTVVACSASNKQFLWSYHIGGSVVANPTMDLTGAYVSSTNQLLVKIDVSNGRRIWRFLAPSPLRTAPMVAGNTVYQFCDGYGLIAIDADTGLQRWRYADAESLLVTMKDRVFVLLENGNVAMLSNKTADSLATLKVDGVIVPLSNTKDPTLLLVATDGRVLAARTTGTPYLRVNQIQAARRTMNLPPSRRPSTAASAVGPQNKTMRGDATTKDPFRSKRDIQR